jgi:hypothetical protein
MGGAGAVIVGSSRSQPEDEVGAARLANVGCAASVTVWAISWLPFAMESRHLIAATHRRKPRIDQFGQASRYVDSVRAQ